MFFSRIGSSLRYRLWLPLNSKKAECLVNTGIGCTSSTLEWYHEAQTVRWGSYVMLSTAGMHKAHQWNFSGSASATSIQIGCAFHHETPLSGRIVRAWALLYIETYRPLINNLEDSSKDHCQWSSAHPSSSPWNYDISVLHMQEQIWTGSLDSESFRWLAAYSTVLYYLKVWRCSQQLVSLTQAQAKHLCRRIFQSFRHWVSA